MKIAATQFNLENNALEIYVSGCTLNCPGCHNPELQDFSLGEPYEKFLPNIIKKLEEFDDIIDNIWILGGEPLDQNLTQLGELTEMVSKYGKKIYLFTGYDLDYIYDICLGYWIIKDIDYIKHGKYDETKLVDDKIINGIKLASSNQGLCKVEDGKFIRM